jgi:NAD(P)H-dependent FMN reductase
MPSPLRIAIIVASIRPNRFADNPLAWLLEQTATRGEFDFEVIDLREHALPNFDLATPPSVTPREYGTAAERALGERLDAADGYIVLTNEYNHSFSGALKNALDHFFVEFNRKPIAFVGYGNVGGARAIEQLRLVIDELDMASVRPTVNILGAHIMAIRAEHQDPRVVFAPLVPRLDILLADLHWWTATLKRGREVDKESTDASDDA